MLNDARQRILTLTLQADMARRDALDVKAPAKVPDPDTQAQSWARLVEMSDEFTLLQFAFNVVPVRNLFAARHDDADCGGLLADLERAGFTVAPVK